MNRAFILKITLLKLFENKMGGTLMDRLLGEEELQWGWGLVARLEG